LLSLFSSPSLSSRGRLLIALQVEPSARAKSSLNGTDLQKFLTSLEHALAKVDTGFAKEKGVNQELRAVDLIE
ncbi:MAG: hypothetical protein ACOVLI_02860, partial [Rhabdaerophilum sp.]